MKTPLPDLRQHGGPRKSTLGMRDVSDWKPNQVARPQPPVDGQVQQGEVADLILELQPDPDNG